MTFTSIAVWGGGAIGATFAAHIAAAGHDLTLIDTNRDHIAAIRSGGLTVDLPDCRLITRLKALHPDEVQGRFDLVLLAVKADRTRQAALQLAPHLQTDAPVVSLQNGLCEAELARYLDPAAVVGAFLNFGADIVAPGHIRVGHRGAVVVGETDGIPLPRTEAIFRLLSLFEPNAVISSNILGYLWSKQAYAAVLKASALCPATLVEFIEDERWQQANIALVREVLHIAQAEGVTFESFDGFNPADFLGDDDRARVALLKQADLYRGSKKTHSSAWMDLAAPIPHSDANAQLRQILETAERHGIATTRLPALVAAIARIEAGQATQSIATTLEWSMAG